MLICCTHYFHHGISQPQDMIDHTLVIEVWRYQVGDHIVQITEVEMRGKQGSTESYRNYRNSSRRQVANDGR